MLYPSSHILIKATRLFMDCFYFKLNQQARECWSTATLLHSKANSSFLSCPYVPLHHPPLSCWCSCLWDDDENQQWYPAKEVGLIVGRFKKKKKSITTPATSLVGFQHYSNDSCTDVDYVELMSNQCSTFPSSATEKKSPDTLYQKKLWGHQAHCSLRRKHLCRDQQLL